MKFPIIKSSLYAALGLALAFAGCTPDSAEESLGPAPTATFTVTPVAGKVNTYLLTSNVPSGFYYRWDLGDGSGANKGTAVDTAYYPEKGSYTIKLLALSDGGYAAAEQSVTVEADDPDGCVGAKAKLTGCGTKTWILAQPEGGALWVGDPGGGQWWSNGAGDLADRFCQFDDEYTFSKSGAFDFNNFGNMRVEDENSAPWPTDIGLSVGCHDMTEIPAKYQAWGSGSHTFKIIGGNKLQVNGTGAFMGLYKVGETGTTAQPETSITYEILELTDTKLVIRKAYDWGQWRFTFKAK